MATMSSEPVRPKVMIRSRPRETETHVPKVTLQEALKASRPNFILRSERRVAVLNQIQKMRQVRAEKQEAWLNHIRALSPESRRRAKPEFSPIPVIRLFSHREMVATTRRKYSALPEVLCRKETGRKEDRNQNNRLRREIYSRQLQQQIMRGRVSLLHHDRIL